MLNDDLSSKILTVGCDYKNPKGGVAQVLWNYSHYIFPEFKCIINSGSKNKIINIFIGVNALVRTIITLIKDSKIKIIHTHTASYNSFWRSSLFINVAKLFNKKVILHIHGGGFKRFYASSPKKISKILNNCDTLIVLSENWRNYFQNIVSNPNIEIANNIVPFPSINKTPLHKISTIHLLFLGQISEEKGIFDLLSVIIDNKSSFKNKICLHIGGIGNIQKLTETIENNGISDIVKYVGWISGDEKINILNSSDIFILPSYVEGLPVSILEAMSYKMPIISTPVGGIPEIVKDNINGYLIKPGDKNGLSWAINDLINNPSKIAQMGDESYNLVSPYFPNYIENQLENIYSKLL